MVPNSKKFTVTLRRTFACVIDSEVQASPFELINLQVQSTICPVYLHKCQNKAEGRPESEGRAIEIKFNLMDTREGKRFDYDNDIEFGNYVLAPKTICCKFTNYKSKNPFKEEEPQEESDEEKNQKMQ